MHTRMMALVVSAIVMIPVAGAESAPAGTLTGTTAVQSGPLAKKLRPQVRAVRLIPAGDQAATFANANRRWSMRVTPGIWAVVKTTMNRTRPRSVVKLVRVRPGKRTTFATKALSGGGGPRVSVGPISWPGPFPDAIRSLIITDLAQEADKAPCEYTVGLSPSDPDYKNVLNELNLNTTKYFSKKIQQDAKKALSELGARKPQYRVVGNVTQLGDVLSGPSSGTFKLVQVATGQVLWEETISLSDSGSNAFIDLIAKSITRAICDVPVAFTGTGQADIVSPLTGQTFSWTGKLGFALDDGGPKPDGTFHFNYKLSFATVDNARYTIPPQDTCSAITGTWSGTPATQTGDLTLIVHDDNSRSYDFSMGLTTPAFDQTGTCGPDAVTLTNPIGVGLTSGAKEPWLGPTLAGTYSGPWPRADVISIPGVPVFTMNGSWVLQPLRDN